MTRRKPTCSSEGAEWQSPAGGTENMHVCSYIGNGNREGAECSTVCSTFTVTVTGREADARVVPASQRLSTSWQLT